MPPTYSGTLRKGTTLNLAVLSGEISQIWLAIYNTFQEDKNISVEGIYLSVTTLTKIPKALEKNNNKGAFDRYMLIQRYLSF